MRNRLFISYDYGRAIHLLAEVVSYMQDLHPYGITYYFYTLCVANYDIVDEISYLMWNCVKETAIL